MRKTVLNQVTFSTDDLSEIQGCFVLRWNLENMDLFLFRIHMKVWNKGDTRRKFKRGGIPHDSKGVHGL